VIDFVNKPVARLILVGLPALALQTTFFAEVKIFGVVLQIMLALSIAAGLAGGSENGALAGFVFGLMFDLVLTSPLGLSALVYGAAGWGAGYLHSRALENPKWLNALVVGLMSGLATFVLPIVANWIGVEGWLSSRLTKVMIVVALSNALFSFLVVPIARWSLAIRRSQRLAPPAEVFL
jgi:rod shape-determining protein MreD